MNSKPDLLLLHGALGASGQFEALARELGRHFAVHTLDFEGHGQSPAADRPFRTAHFAENILAYLDREAIEHAHVFGYSMGGYAALYAARTWPGRLSRVFTLSTKLDWSPEFAAGEVRMLDPERIAEKVPAFARLLERRHSAYGWRNVLKSTEEMMLTMGEGAEIDANLLGAIEQPVRIAVGDRDHMVSVAECVEAYRSLPQGELEVFPATPHPIEKVPTDRLARALIEFFHAG
ncbi:alpha/beta fold hydrolase [Ectothiorhodospiraceae bacterium WFHF3C12]|nr:alpha/beta fold hydrolase [Ectothiorhodospiraceae bacterium WFHF3C12]